MEDETKTITDYKIAENGFIVVMTVKVSKRFGMPTFNSSETAFFFLTSG